MAIDLKTDAVCTVLHKYLLHLLKKKKDKKKIKKKPTNPTAFTFFSAETDQLPSHPHTVTSTQRERNPLPPKAVS